MMTEIARAVAGLLRLVRFASSGLGCFDRTWQGFWRWFRVALLILPAYAVILPLEMQVRAPAAGWARVLLVELLIYIVGWVAQVVIIGLGLLTPWMYAMGIIFALIWVTCMVLGKRLEAAQAGRDNT